MSSIIDVLTKEELGRLFPVEIVRYNKQWSELFENEKKTLRATTGQNTALRIEHFGSTSVCGLAAKPTIDILMEIPLLTDELKMIITNKMKQIEYDFIWRSDSENPYMMFAKGYCITGKKEQTFHIHAVPDKHPLWDGIFFRDYLRQHPETAKQYEKLKFELAEKYKYDREEYTFAKTDFITTVLKKAKRDKI